MNIAIVRGAFLNQFEMQNFVPLAKGHKIVAFSSLRPIHDKVGFPVVKLPSPMDLLSFTPILQCNGVKRILRGVLNRVFIDAHYLLGLEKKLRGFDIAHCAETYFYYTQQCLVAKKKGWVKRVVCSVSDTIPFNNEGIWGRRKFKRRAREGVDLFLAWTNLAKEALIAEGCSPEKIMVVPMGVDLDNFQLFRKSEVSCGKPISNFQFPKKELTILFVGRLEEEKGVRELLEAYRELIINPGKAEDPRSKHRDNKQLTIKLKIVGEGSLEKWIREWIKINRQGSNVTIEQLRYQDVPKIYQTADIFILASKKTGYWQEHFGMVLVEAMASSLPIVATKSGAIPEVVGKCGLLVKEQDVKGLYKALKRLLEDKSLRIKLGKMGRDRAEKYFDSQKVAKKIGKIYLRILE